MHRLSYHLLNDNLAISANKSWFQWSLLGKRHQFNTVKSVYRSCRILLKTTVVCILHWWCSLTFRTPGRFWSRWWTSWLNGEILSSRCRLPFCLGKECLQYSCASGKFLWFTASLLFFLLPILADHTWLCSFILSNDKKVEQNWVASCGFCFPDEQGRVISEARKSSSCENIFLRGTEQMFAAYFPHLTEHNTTRLLERSAPYAGLDLTSSGFSSHGVLFL